MLLDPIIKSNTALVSSCAMVDTNTDPDDIDVIIPANDDAIRAVKLITAKNG